MSEISLCSCNVRLAGDLRNVVHRGESRPVTWPEVEVLMYLHGEDAVYDIKVIGKGDTTIAEEFERLVLRYGRKPVAELFPGKRPAMVLKAPDSVDREKGSKTKAADPFD